MTVTLDPDPDPASEEDAEEAVSRLRESGAHSPLRERYIREAQGYGNTRAALLDMARFYRYMAGRSGELTEVAPHSSHEPIE